MDQESMGAFQEFPQVSSGLFNEQKNCFFFVAPC